MTSLPTRQLGTTGMHISRIGFGAWAVGGSGWRYAWGGQDDAESIATIRRAVEAGVNWIDTAAVYGLGHSEEVVAKATAGLPEAERPYIFTKAGLVWDESDRSAAPRRIMAAASVRREIEDSLRRLNVERIDLYQVHWPDTGASLEFSDPDGVEATTVTPLEEYWQTMAELVTEGKVRAIGLSNHDVPQLEIAESIAHVDAIQPQFSLIKRGSADELAWAAAHHTGGIVYQPQHSGLLTGTFSAERVANLPNDDWRKGFPEFTTELDRNLALVDALRPIAAAHDTTVGSVAIAWTLTRPGVTGAIVGARRPDQIDGWIDAAALELTAADLDAIATALRATGAGEGPILR
ncbi:aldo/keto reductase [Nocardia sp. NEAU-G5]|uniref:Aldo/keto reductase n=1 Tax=Nocardia albiluteola TaxID=2842303 RepID=A0ABS6BB87_9NOCA|nr:aldo/keto reductase [Nocardia albiluteola]MBU3067050.1 aldo/keto reductase [Nocardia albiluteola]